MNIKFTKLQGAGNDYMYLDAVNDLPFCVSDDADFYRELSVKISDRHFGAGSDGIIAILPPSAEGAVGGADFRMRMFNADGSEGEMCGNGIRCFAKYIYDSRLTDKKIINIETLAGIKTVEVFLAGAGGRVKEARVFMGIPSFETGKIPANFDKPEIVMEKFSAGGKDFEISCVSMGNPHCVIFVDDAASFDVHYYGRLIENDKMFPNRINVEFAQILDADGGGGKGSAGGKAGGNADATATGGNADATANATGGNADGKASATGVGNPGVLVRTWERGSGETLACGTGACAVYSVMRKTGKIGLNPSASLDVNLYGGTLKITGELSEGIYMTGPAEEVFTGYFNFAYKRL